MELPKMTDLLHLSRSSNSLSRSISPENPTGEAGGGAKEIPPKEGHPARELGKGWKVRPCITLPAGSTTELADIAGPGIIRQIWLTQTGTWRDHIFRITWDDQSHPSVEVPVGDFFASGWQEFGQISSLPVCVNPGSAFNSYWQMPFLNRARISMENRGKEDSVLYYQINYDLTEVPDDSLYFHSWFNRSNPLAYKTVHSILEIAEGEGNYVGTAIAWGSNNGGWWGEGEVKFFIDDDQDYPTICGTGTEDYFGGSYNFDVGAESGGYREFTTPYSGLSKVIRPDGLYNSQMRFSMYRWHITDPVRFNRRLKVVIQALGWRSEGRFLPLQDDISSTAFWYQRLPSSPLPTIQSRDELEIV